MNNWWRKPRHNRPVWDQIIRAAESNALMIDSIKHKLPFRDQEIISIGEHRVFGIISPIRDRIISPIQDHIRNRALEEL